MGDKQQTIYKSINKDNCSKLIQASESNLWPKNKRYTVNCNGTDFKVSVSLSKTQEKVPSYNTYYDAYSAIESLHEVMVDPDKIWYEHEGPIYELVFDTDRLEKLDAEQIKQRIDFMIAVSNLINNQDTIDAIVRSAEKKKNGTFDKRKKYKIACSGLAYNNEILALIGIPKTDTTMTIAFETVSPKIGDNEIWASDFISVYHVGLPISIALKKAFDIKENRTEESEQTKLTIPSKYQAINKAPSYLTKESLKQREEEKAYYCQFIDEIEDIDLNNKAVVFDNSICTSEAFRTDPKNPIVKKVMDAGAIGARNRVSGKTDFFFVSTDDPWLNNVGDGWKLAVEQKQKGKPIKIVTIKNLLSIIDKE